MVVAWNKFLLEAAGDPAHPIPTPWPNSVRDRSGRIQGARRPDGSLRLGVRGHRLDPIRRTDEIRPVPQPARTFVLADSQQKKNTTGTLGFIKSHVLDGAASIRKAVPGFSLRSPQTPEILAEIEKLPPDNRRLLLGTLATRDLTAKAPACQAPDFDEAGFGRLLNEQHAVLRDRLRNFHAENRGDDRLGT